MAPARAPRAPKAAPKAADLRRPLDPFVWKACAGSNVKIPAVGSRVFYFPQGHVEQASTAPDFSTVSGTKPYALCRVAAVQFLADQESDEVFAKISLDPRAETLTEVDFPAAAAEQDVGGGEAAAAFAKILTPSDANNGGGFSVPRFCADSIFPLLDFNSETPVQTLMIRDLLGNVWNFRHIYRGTPRRHLLTTGWSKFVNAKKLVAGDSVVFIRSSSGEVFVGLRRRSCGGVNLMSNAVGGVAGFVRNGRGRVAAASVVEAVTSAAAADRVFEVEYYPRNRAAEFVVAEEVLVAAMKVPWVAGIKVTMGVETEDACRITWHHGTVDATVQAVEGPWALSPWRMLKIKWEDPELVRNMQNVSPWQVELIPGIPQIGSSYLGAGEHRVSQNPVNGSDNMMTGSLPASRFSYNAFLAGMQGARQLPKNNDQPSHSENMAGSDSVQEITAAYPEGSSPTSTLPYENLLPPSKESDNDTRVPSKRARSMSIQLFGQVIETEEPFETEAVKQHKEAGIGQSDDPSSASPRGATIQGFPETYFRNWVVEVCPVSKRKELHLQHASCTDVEGKR